MISPEKRFIQYLYFSNLGKLVNYQLSLIKEEGLIFGMFFGISSDVVVNV